MLWVGFEDVKCAVDDQKHRFRSAQVFLLKILEKLKYA